MSENIVLDPEGSFTNLRFNAPADWHIEMSDDAQWVEISPMEGTAGKGRLKIKAEVFQTLPLKIWKYIRLTAEQSVALFITVL